MGEFQNSKVEPLKYSAFDKIQHIDLLRDDLIHPIVCGNKWRKLKYAIEFIKANQLKNIVTFGGAYSNHVIATAYAGKAFNIQTVAFIRGDEVRAMNHYEQLAIDCGMTLHHVDRAAYKDKRALFNQYFSNDTKAFFLDEGGNHPLALKGCAEILDELTMEYDYIILPLGTGTTMEGLVKGVIEKKLNTKIVGISSLKNNFELDFRLEHYSNSVWRVFHNYHRGKYAKSDAELEQFIAHFMNETGVPIETVYTGKMMMAVADLIQQYYFKPTDKLLLVHTGGLMNV